MGRRKKRIRSGMARGGHTEWGGNRVDWHEEKRIRSGAGDRVGREYVEEGKGYEVGKETGWIGGTRKKDTMWGRRQSGEGVREGGEMIRSGEGNRVDWHEEKGYDVGQETEWGGST
jgi:hypothetical protein